jgi:fructan beta-fructosidase
MNMKNRNIAYLMSAILSLALLSACHHQSVVTVSAPNDTTTILKVEGADRYLIVPVEDNAAPLTMLLEVGGKRVPLASVRLARTRADYYVPVKLPDGANTVVVLHAPKNAFFLSHLEMDDHFEQTAESRLRPVYHYAPAFGWMGRPAAVVRDDNGAYHLFYECNPQGCKAENYHWGQALSEDLIHWNEQEPAFGGDSIGEALGGSIVVDKRNVFGVGENAWIALYTATHGEGIARRQEQCVAYSTDEGKTFTKFRTNPVLRTYDDNPDFRHPNVVRYRRGSIWDVVLACKEELRIYSSTELGTWNLESCFGNDWAPQPISYESGQLFEKTMANGRSVWLLLCTQKADNHPETSISKCFVGKFDGKNFIPDDTKGFVLDGGFDYSGAMAFDNGDNRCLLFANLENSGYRIPSFPFNGVAALPRELSVSQVQGKWQVSVAPARELEGLRQETKGQGPFEVNGTKDLKQILAQNEGAFELTMQVAQKDARRLAIIICNEKGEQTELALTREGEWQLNRTKGGRFPDGMTQSAMAAEKLSVHRLQIFVDRTSVEAFLDGHTVMSDLIFPSQPFTSLRFQTEGGKAEVSNLKVYRLDAKKK